MKALIIMDMTNDFVFEKYEHEGEEYEGRFVAPLGKTIVEPITSLVRKVVNSGTVSFFETFYYFLVFRFSSLNRAKQ